MHGLFGREPINFRRPKWTASFFPVLVREFLHQFMTILAIKIGQGLGRCTRSSLLGCSVMGFAGSWSCAAIRILLLYSRVSLSRASHLLT